jgi:hypothetical protein
MRFVILDSLDKCPSHGFLGKAQRDWLSSYLTEHTDKPVILFVHHSFKDYDGELIDAERMFNIVKPQHHVKAVVYGHTHSYNYSVRDNIHLINLPSTAYTLFLPFHLELWQVLLNLMVAGLGSGALVGALPAAAAAAAPRGQTGIASALKEKRGDPHGIIFVQGPRQTDKCIQSLSVLYFDDFQSGIRHWLDQLRAGDNGIFINGK